MEYLRIAVVVPIDSTNMFTSMQDDAYQAQRGVHLNSYGNSDMMNFPFKPRRLPKCYDFATPFDVIHYALRKEELFCTGTDVLDVLKKNATIVTYLECIQESGEMFDFIITCYEEMFENVINWFSDWAIDEYCSVPIINIEFKDIQQGVTGGASRIYKMVEILLKYESLDEDITPLLNFIDKKLQKPPVSCRMHY